MKALFSLIIAVALLCGCQTSNTAGRLLASTTITVDSSMKGWAAYVNTGNATTAQEDQVRAAYEKYQHAEAAAERAYLASAKLNDASVWQQASAALVASRESLLQLIDSFNPTPSTKGTTCPQPSSHN